MLHLSLFCACILALFQQKSTSGINEGQAQRSNLRSSIFQRESLKTYLQVGPGIFRLCTGYSLEAK